jgi:hypothetical protein
MKVLVKNRKCYISAEKINFFVGTISRKNFSWVGNVEPPDGEMTLVVIETKEGKPLKFSKKIMTDIDSYTPTIEDIKYLLSKLDKKNFGTWGSTIND